MSSLFRKEALDHKADSRFGQALVHIPRSYSLFILFLVGVTSIFVIMLIYGDYARKETVSGVLVPSQGLTRIYAPRSGVIANLYATNGTQLKQNQQLLTLSSQTHLKSGKSLNQLQQKLIAEQLVLLDSQIEDEVNLSHREGVRQQAAINEHNSAIWQLRNQLKVEQKLVDLKQSQFQHATELANKKYMTDAAKNEAYQLLLQQQQSLENNKRILLAKQSELNQLTHDLSQFPLVLNKRTALLKSQRAQLRAQLSQVSAQGAEQLKATEKSKVTAIQVQEGDQVIAGQFLMALLPADAQLEAELFLPNRAAGFVKQGQEVRIRFQAFPYQRYGIHGGTVIETSEIILKPTEVDSSINIVEAVYKVRVKLDHQTIKAFGDESALQSGMQLEADIVLDTMSLLDWIMMPLLAVKGSL